MPELTFRKAKASDIPAIVALLADDVLGAGREKPEEALSAGYAAAFAAIDGDERQYLAVVEDHGVIIGTLQLTFIPCLSRGGRWRGLVEAVRVASDRRSQGVGEAMMAWAIDQCRARGCGLVQLTTDKSRLAAHRFYDRLGFTPSHLGYKLEL
ncbi:GNAT family N-acetyltransferase [soil metagenome]